VGELRETEAGEGFTFAREKSLHHTALVSLQGLHFRPLGGNHLVQRRQAVGDLLLLASPGKSDQELFKLTCVEMNDSALLGHRFFPPGVPRAVADRMVKGH
jgi:hypothetical protein